MKRSKKIPILALAGTSNSGKTTLLKKLIRVLTARGYRIGAIKHTHHAFQFDKPGKDSHMLKAAGAEAVCIFSTTQLGLVCDLSEEPSLEKIVLKYFSEVDLVLAEGFKRSNVPHLLIAHSMSALLEVPHLIAVVSKIIKRSDSKKISYFTPNQTNSIADFIEERFLR